MYVIICSVSDKYLSDFVLHGTTQKDFTKDLYDDLKAVVKVRQFTLLFMKLLKYDHYFIVFGR